VPPIVPLETSAPRHVLPIPAELNTGANWEAFWDRLKQAYPNWSAGFDRVKVQLEQDYWNLRPVFQSSDKQLSRVIKQSGLRVVIHEELSKFVDAIKQAHRLSTSPIAITEQATSGLRRTTLQGSQSSSSVLGEDSSDTSDHQI
jgi:hypothetical protein